MLLSLVGTIGTDVYTSNNAWLVLQKQKEGNSDDQIACICIFIFVAVAVVVVSLAWPRAVLLSRLCTDSMDDHTMAAADLVVAVVVVVYCCWPQRQGHF
jgi:hypothetical protein